MHTNVLRLAAAAALFASWDARAQQLPTEVVEQAPAHARKSLGLDQRSIRRDIPLPNSVRRALRSGTRSLTGKPGPSYWQLRTDFDIHVRLDAANQTLFGSETIVVHNRSNDDLRRIALRLDHNLFRFGVQRGSSVPAEQTDGMVVTRIALDGVEVDLAYRPRRRRSREEVTQASVQNLQQTVATIIPATPIKAGTKLELKIDWHTKLPGGDAGRGHRMTQRWGDTLFQPTQWFPRLCKYDDVHGWLTSPYLGPAEFYNNFGSFDVEFDVPGGWLVSGTGELQNADEVLSERTRKRLATVLDSDDEVTIVDEDERGSGAATAPGDRLTWRFHADMVNDFAWATAKDYMWKATRASIPGKGPVPVHMLFLPERANRFRRAGAITRHALEFYSELWAPYPFPQLTLQDGPSAGMEYPMVINSNQSAADHEVAHQWWPMMLGTNETMYGWMDEGFNTYMNILSAAHQRGRKANLDGRGQIYGRRSGDESEPPMMWTANYAGRQYGFQTYSKAPMMLSMLGGLVDLRTSADGDEIVQEAMRNYTRTWAFKHPTPWDFVFFMQHELGIELGWFFYYWLWTTDTCDGSIQSVQQQENEVVITVHQAGQMPSPIVLDVVFADGFQLPKIEGALLVENNSLQITRPVDVWFDGKRSYELRLPCRLDDITSMQLDRRGRFPDSNSDDNAWPRAKRDPSGSRRRR